jgi:hypothetical protein
MRKLLFAGLVALLAGCSSKEEAPSSGIGVVPLGGATVTGNVVEASQPSGVLVKTASDRSFLLPDDWEYRMKGGKAVKVSELTPGTQVTAVAPSRDARLVSADGNTLVMESNNDFFSFPVEGLAAEAQRVPVMVQTEGGQTWDMPLGQAVNSYPFGIRSHPQYAEHAFPEADPYAVHKGMAVGMYDNSPLFLTPTSAGPGLVRMPYLPAENLVGHQPVRFTYADNNVAVTSWDSLGDGQFDISDLLLAGTLLDILPGKAVVQVDQRPITVPWEYLTYRGAPVGQQRYPVGTPVGVRYYPGVYDLVSYDPDIATFLYQQQAVQIPVNRLPRDRHHHHRVKIRQPKGQWVSLPFSAAQPLLANGDYWLAPSSAAIPYVQYWDRQQTWKPRPVKGYPGYQLVGHQGHERVVRLDRPGRKYRNDRDSWWTRQPDWSYAVSSLAGPAAWTYSDYQRPLVRVGTYQDPRYNQYPNVAWNTRGHRDAADKGKKRAAKVDINYWNYGKRQNLAWNKGGKHHNVGNVSFGRQPQGDWRHQRGGQKSDAWDVQKAGDRSQVKKRQRQATGPRQDQRGRERAVRQQPRQPQKQRVSQSPARQQRSVEHRKARSEQARPERVAKPNRQRQRVNQSSGAQKVTPSSQRQSRVSGGRSQDRAPRVASQAPRQKQQRADKGEGARQRGEGGKRR